MYMSCANNVSYSMSENGKTKRAHRIVPKIEPWTVRTLVSWTNELLPSIITFKHQIFSHSLTISNRSPGNPIMQSQFMSICTFTISNAELKSRLAINAHWSLLIALVIRDWMQRPAISVLCFCLKPCWDLWVRSMLFLVSFTFRRMSNNFSKILEQVLQSFK